jgi:hypothetical protein
MAWRLVNCAKLFANTLYQKNLDITVLGITTIGVLRCYTLRRINFVWKITISLRIGLEDLRLSLYQIGLYTACCRAREVGPGMSPESQELVVSILKNFTPKWIATSGLVLYSVSSLLPRSSRSVSRHFSGRSRRFSSASSSASKLTPPCTYSRCFNSSGKAAHVGINPRSSKPSIHAEYVTSTVVSASHVARWTSYDGEPRPVPCAPPSNGVIR